MPYIPRPATASIWFRSYVQTYLERDVRAISSIRDLSVFRRFLALLSSRAGQVLNKTDLAAPLGVSVSTISEWLSILEITGQIILVPPFYENFGKRLIKSPKLYFVDSGMLCHLLGIDSERLLNRSPFLGPVFESHVASEIIKEQQNTGRGTQLYYFRDQQGLEVDFVVPLRGRTVLLLEAKASRTVLPDMARPLRQLAGAMSQYEPRCFVVHRSGKEDLGTSAVSPGTRAVPVERLSEIL
ncbi:MAG TPA: DUF4143 domain-containing protein [Phycisphaerae bacterium]|jgi:hypothetical protein